MSGEEEEEKTGRIVWSHLKKETLLREQIGDYELRKARAEALSAELNTLASLWGLAGPMGLGEKWKDRAKSEVLRLGNLMVPDRGTDCPT